MKIGDEPVKIYRDLAGVVSLQTIKLWIKIVNNTGSINLSSPLVIHASLVQKPISRRQNCA
jgi:hypothetical protein